MRIVVFFILFSFPLFLYSQESVEPKVNCDSLLQINMLHIYNFKRVVKENNDKISSLEMVNKELIRLINEHNNKLKSSQEKYKIKLEDY